MKKIILILLLIPNIWITYMPASINDYTIWRVSDIDQWNQRLSIKFDNFINFKITHKLNTFRNRNYFKNNFTEIINTPEDLNIQNWDIVAVGNQWSGWSHWILKINCINSNVIATGTKNQVFGTWSGTIQNDKLLEKEITNKIWCDNLQNFFNEDRTLQDLQGNNILRDIYKLLAILFMLVWSAVIYLKIKLWKKY